jgi:hypothetical protein
LVNNKQALEWLKAASSHRQPFQIEDQISGCKELAEIVPKF